MSTEGLSEDQQRFRDLQAYLVSENYDKAIEICNAIRSRRQDDLEAIRVKCLCLIYKGEFEKALKTVSGNLRAQFAFERAYCLFRLGRLQESLEVCREASSVDGDGSGGDSGGGGGGRDEALRHLEAQVNYKLSEHARAVEIYTQLDEEKQAGGGGAGSGEGDDTPVNLVAACTMAGRAGEALERYPVDEAMEDAAEGEVAWELLYNLGTALLHPSWASGGGASRAGAGVPGGAAVVAQACLRRARRACRETLAAEGGYTKSEVEDEGLIVAVQLALATSLRGDTHASAEACKKALKAWPSDPAVAAVATNNLAAWANARRDGNSEAALRRLEAAIPEVDTAAAGEGGTKQQGGQHGLNVGQLETAQFNSCLLLLYSGKVEECRERLSRLRGLYPHSPRLAEVEATRLHLEGKQAEAEGVLEAAVQADVGGGGAGAMPLRLLLAQVKVMRGDVRGAAQSLEGLDKGVASSPAAAATLAAMYEAVGDRSGAERVVQRSLEELESAEELDGQAKACAMLAMADWLLGTGRHRAAAAAYSKVLELGVDVDGNVRLTAMASSVIAYSWFDPDKARRAAASLPAREEEDEDESLDAQELELTELPRSGKAKRLAMVAGAKGVGKSSARQGKQSGEAAASASKDPEKRLKKRAKARKKYLAELVVQGKLDPNKPPPKPDPERWIPKQQRSYAKRGKKRNKLVGAQGSGDGGNKDAARLDAAARAQAKKDKAASSDEQKATAGRPNLPPPGARGKKGRR